MALNRIERREFTSKLARTVGKVLAPMALIAAFLSGNRETMREMYFTLFNSNNEQSGAEVVDEKMRKLRFAPEGTNERIKIISDSLNALDLQSEESIANLQNLEKEIRALIEFLEANGSPSLETGRSFALLGTIASKLGNTKEAYDSFFQAVTCAMRAKNTLSDQEDPLMVSLEFEEWENNLRSLQSSYDEIVRNTPNPSGEISAQDAQRILKETFEDR